MIAKDIECNPINLLEAAQRCCWDDCRKWLNQHPNIILDDAITTGEYEGFQSLHFFAMHGQTELARLIIAAGVSPTVKTKAGQVPIELALKNALQSQSFETVNLLINAHDDLLLAARDQRWEVCNRVLKNGIKDTWKLTGKYEHYNPAHFFVLHDQESLLQSAAMNPEFHYLFQFNTKQATPLALAAKTSRWNCVTAIVNTLKRPHQNEEGSYGYALSLAATAHEWEVCASLINARPNIAHSKDDNWEFFIHTFIKYEQIDLIKLTVNIYPSCLQHISSTTNLTPIALAAKTSRWQCVTAIANQFCVSPFDDERYGYALTLATEACEWDVCKALLKAGASLNPAPNDTGYSLIHHFAAHGQSLLLQLVSERYRRKGFALPCNQTSKKQTPIDLAKINKHWEVVHFLARESQQQELHILYYAAQAQKWDKCAELLQQDAPLVFEQKHAIHYFAQYGQSDLLLSSINKGANVCAITPDGKTAIEVAADYAQWDTILILSQHIKLTPFDREGYRYAYGLALARKEFAFCTTMLKQNFNYDFQVMNQDHGVIHTILLKKQAMACKHIVKSDPFIVDRIWEFCFSNNVISQFFTHDADFSDHLIPLDAAIPLLNAGVPFKKFSAYTQGQLLKTDVSAIGPIAYFNLLISGLPKKSAELIANLKPELSISARPLTQIGTLSNREFCEFRQFTSELLSHVNTLHKSSPPSSQRNCNEESPKLARNAIQEIPRDDERQDDFQKKPTNKKINSTLKALTTLSTRCDAAMYALIDRKYLSSLYNKIKKKKTYSSMLSLWKKPALTLEMFHPDLVCHYDKATLESLAVIIREKAVNLPINAPEFPIIFYFACCLTRVFPEKRQSFLPDTTAKIGVFLSQCEYCNSDSLVFVGDTLATCSVYIVDEIIDILSKRDAFIDPVTFKELEWKTIEALLGHPKIQQTVMELHTSKSSLKEDGILILKMIRSVKPTIAALKTLSNELWESSLDSGKQTFDNVRADRAMEVFRQYSATMSTSLLSMLHDPNLSFYLGSRGKKTNYSELFFEATYNTCAGQLGATIKNWIKAFEETEQQLLGLPTKMSGYVKWITENDPNPLYLTESTPEYQMDGHLLSSLFTLRFELNANNSPTSSRV